MLANPSKERPLSQAVTQSLSQTVIISAKLNNEEAVHLAAGLVSCGLDVTLLDLSDSDKKLEKTVKTNSTIKKQIAVLVSAPFAAMERIERWADAMTLTAPGHSTRRATSDSARIHLLVQFLIASKEDGGCGIKVDGTNTDLIIIHDAEWEKLWLSTWSKKWLLDASDFSSIQRYLGEEIAMYFAFINHFLVALIPLASIGVLAHLFLPEYSAYYAVFLTLWGVTFLVSWKRQESSLAEMWRSKPESSSWKRPEFKSDQPSRQGIVAESYSFWKRWIVHVFLTGPIVLLFAGLVALASAAILMMQVYTADFYNGPYKSVVSMTPVMVYVISIPTLQSLYHTITMKLTNLENSRTQSSHTSSLTRKSFLLTLLITQLPLLLSALVFIPFSDKLLPHLSTTPSLTETSNLLTPQSLRDRVIYFCMTGQVVNQATEVLLPYLQSLYTSHTLKKKLSKQGIVNEDDDSETIEQKIRKRVVKALSLPEYNLYDDYAELGNQFALIVMFSIVWPLAGVCFLVNNWMEVRTDAFKICRAVRRPIPREGRGIGPWFGIFWVVSVVGAVCTGWIVGVYGGEVNLEGAASERTLERIPRALVGVFVAEHFHIIVWWLIEFGFGVVFGSGVERELELHNSRRRNLQETIEQVHKEEDGEEDMDERVERVVELVSSVF